MNSTLPPALDVAGAPAVAANSPPAQPAVACCENCGARLSGRYCGNCGQRREGPVHSLWHFTQVAAEDLTHADSRLWRTLAALLCRPGLLTREFLSGRRARYLPPLRLYLVLSVAFFLLASVVQPHLTLLRVDPPRNLAAAKNGPVIYDVTAPDRPGETHAQHIERECAGWTYDGPWQRKLGPLMPQLCRKILADNGYSLQEAFLHNVPRAMFVFLPLLAGVMMLMYWRPRHYYVEHLLLFVHNHAVVFLVGTLLLLLDSLAPHLPFVRAALFWYFLWYMYRSMRAVYGQGRALTGAKLAVLSFFYLIFAATMLAITTIYSALTL
jgi:hypothetical protein